MSSRHERFLRLAETHASKSRHPRWKMGAIVVSAGRVLGSGTNQPKNDPAIEGIPLTSCSVHAEVSALRGVDAAGATLYVARITRRGGWGLAKPCHRCEAFVRQSGVRRVVWTMNDDEYGVTLLQRNL
jgi:deoxycytidylate deaminase